MIPFRNRSKFKDFILTNFCVSFRELCIRFVDTLQEVRQFKFVEETNSCAKVRGRVLVFGRLCRPPAAERPKAPPNPTVRESAVEAAMDPRNPEVPAHHSKNLFLAAGRP